MTIQWNTYVYTQERSILTLSDYDANTAAIELVSINPYMISAKYVIPISRAALKIDLSDLVRVVESVGSTGGSFNIIELDSDGKELHSYEKTYTIIGRINPKAYFRALPPDDMADTFELAVSAPSVMYKRLSNNADPIRFELASGYGGYQFATGRIKFPPLVEEPIEFARAIEVPSGADSVEFWHLNDIMYYRYPLKDLECGKRYAEVEWVSFTGQTRRHVFEVVRLTEETTNEISLETITNEYDVSKDLRISFSLRLDGLTAYDYWYYSDLVTSRSVKVSLSGTNYRKVQVTAKKSTIPETSAGKPLTLEIPINYVRYDTL